MNFSEKTRELVKDLLAGASEDERCEFLGTDREGVPYCSKSHVQLGRIDSFERRIVCDPVSLQLYCLAGENCKKCIYYRGVVV